MFRVDEEAYDDKDAHIVPGKGTPSEHYSFSELLVTGKPSDLDNDSKALDNSDEDEGDDQESSLRPLI